MFYFIWVLAFLSSCTGLRKIPDGEFLYTSGTIEIPETEKESRKAEKIVEEVLTPEPNSSLFGMRPQLWVYQSIGDSVKGPIRKWIRKTFGQKTVLLSDFDPEQVAAVMQNHLFHDGYFNAEVSASVEKQKRTAKVLYTASGLQPYHIDSIVWPAVTPLDDSVLKVVLRNTSLKKGDVYRLSALQDERERIASALQSSGYYYFSDNYLFFAADSSLGSRNVALQLMINPETPEMAFRKYYFRKLILNATYNPADPSNDTLRFGATTIITDGFLRPEVLLRRNFIEPGAVYSKHNYKQTYNKLSSLGILRYVKPSINRFENTDSLDVYFDLVSRYPLSFNASVDFSTATNNYTGPGVNLGLTQRNIFGGAEVLSIQLDAQYQMQIGNRDEYFYSIGLNSELAFPRFFPFHSLSGDRTSDVTTSLQLGGKMQDRVGVYTIASGKTSLVYRISRKKSLGHYFSPFELTYVKLLESSAQLDSIMTENPYMRQSFEEQFIPAGWYKIVINNFSDAALQSNYYASVKTEFAGNLFSLMSDVLGAQKSDSGYYTFAGQPFSQYFRYEADFRYYIGKPGKSRLALRFFNGAGIPYGNSDALPYIRQFYSGGPDGLRAFYARSIGPGTLTPPEEAEDQITNNQTGEVKLELNAEYRFPIAGFLKGAFFVDAGNIWMINDGQGEDARFHFDSFYKELAVGAGTGFRLDFSFLLLRFDFAFPLRKPWIEKNNGWVIDDIALGKSSWRKDNLILNVALGYPF